jgi:hypothetical protein
MPTTSPVPTSARPWRGSLMLWAGVAGGASWSAWLGLHSPGAPLDDEIGHYLMSRFALIHPANLFNPWARFLPTALYAIPAHAGLTAARMTSVLIAALTALTAAYLARRLGSRRWYLVPVLVFFQPWYASLMSGVLTEVPFALFLVAGVYCWRAERFRWASLWIGLLPLTRHEGIALTGLWILLLLHRRDWRSVAVALMPFVLYNIASWPINGEPSLTIFFRPHATSFYGHGGWLDLVRPVASQAGLPIVLLMLLGLVPGRDLAQRSLYLSPFAFYLGLHILLYRFGLFATGGYVEFLVPIAPAIAVLAVFGIERTEDGVARLARAVGSGPLERASTIGATAAIVLATAAYGLTHTQRWQLGPQEITLRDAARWVSGHGLGQRRIVSANVWFDYFTDTPVGPQNYWWIVPDPDSVQSGTIFIWDRHYCPREGIDLSRLTSDRTRWSELAAFGRDTSTAVFQRLGSLPP